eukprot:3886312-Amphidinium_carterae.1
MLSCKSLCGSPSPARQSFGQVEPRAALIFLNYLVPQSLKEESHIKPLKQARRHRGHLFVRDSPHQLHCVTPTAEDVGDMMHSWRHVCWRRNR